MTSMRDPVCGKFVTEETAHAVTEYQDHRYLFCSRGCRVAFKREPEICLAGTELEKVAGPDGVDRWACQRPEVPENRRPRRNQHS